MGKSSLPGIEDDKKKFLFDSGIGWNPQQDCFHPGGLFATIGHVGIGFGISPNSPNTRVNNVAQLPYTNLYSKYVSIPESEFRFYSREVGEDMVVNKKRKKGALRLKVKIANPSLRRLISGAIAGAVSRTVVAPLETIRTHLMVGSCGHSMGEVFDSIMKTDGWKGLFRGNFVNVIRVAPSKALELYVYDTVKKSLTPKHDNQTVHPIPPSLLAGAAAGVCSTLCTYPLELLKTRITIQRGVYKSFLDAFVKIVQEEGPAELFRGLTPSLIGVIPYAATNYFAYDSLRIAYRKAFHQEEIGNIMTLLIGSVAAVISSTATFPLEVARKQMQAGALNGRHYKSMLHALATILEKEGVSGLYRGLSPSCMKLVPAAGISFMCYEACKRILIEKEDDH